MKHNCENDTNGDGDCYKCAYNGGCLEHHIKLAKDSQQEIYRLRTILGSYSDAISKLLYACKDHLHKNDDINTPYNHQLPYKDSHALVEYALNNLHFVYHREIPDDDLYVGLIMEKPKKEIERCNDCGKMVFHAWGAAVSVAYESGDLCRCNNE